MYGQGVDGGFLKQWAHEVAVNAAIAGAVAKRSGPSVALKDWEESKHPRDGGKFTGGGGGDGDGGGGKKPAGGGAGSDRTPRPKPESDADQLSRIARTMSDRAKETADPHDHVAAAYAHQDAAHAQEEAGNHGKWGEHMNAAEEHLDHGPDKPETEREQRERIASAMEAMAGATKNPHDIYAAGSARSYAEMPIHDMSTPY